MYPRDFKRLTTDGKRFSSDVHSDTDLDLPPPLFLCLHRLFLRTQNDPSVRLDPSRDRTQQNFLLVCSPEDSSPIFRFCSPNYISSNDLWDPTSLFTFEGRPPLCRRRYLLKPPLNVLVDGLFLGRFHGDSVEVLDYHRDLSRTVLSTAGRGGRDRSPWVELPGLWFPFSCSTLSLLPLVIGI